MHRVHQICILLYSTLLLIFCEGLQDPFLRQVLGSCKNQSYHLEIQTSLPFMGRLFSKRFKDCLAIGNGSMGTSLRVSSECGLTNYEPQFSDQVYVQKDPFLQQADDEVVEIHCRGNGSASLIRYGGNSEPMYYQNLQTTFEVNNANEDKSTAASVKRQLDLSNEIKDDEVGVYVQAWMDLLPTYKRAQNSHFYIGQNVSLVIKWKNPKSKQQPKVGACSASSGQKESLALTNDKGQSLQKIFPSNFTYTSKAGITTASASLLMFKFAKSNQLIFTCRLIFQSKVPIVLEALAENIIDQREEAETSPLNAESPSHYLRSDDLSAQEAKQELLEIEREFEEPQVCMSRIRVVLAFGVLILVLFIALVFSCMLWSRAKSFTSHLNSSKLYGGLIPRRFKSVPGPYVVSSVPYR